MPNRIESFSHHSRELTAVFQETIIVAPGVECDVYVHPETKRRDLAIVRVEAGKNTPAQKVLKGRVTVEGYRSGKGRLIIIHKDGSRSEFEVGPESEGFSYSATIGETMQWQAAEDEPLEFFEICFPPYEDGRFEDLSLDKI